MSEIEIKVPELSESVSSAEVLGWKVKPGDPVEEDQVLVELETDKVVLEVSAPCDGVVTEILVKEGDTVKTGDVVAKVEEGAAKAPRMSQPQPPWLRFLPPSPRRLLRLQLRQPPRLRLRNPLSPA